MIDSPVSLILGNSVKDSETGGIVQYATRKLQATWQRSIRDIGGYWIGTAQWEGPAWEMLDLFQSGMLYEIREVTGGLITWQGFLAEMVLTYKGIRYSRSWADVANKVKCVYSKMGENLITNNSCETTVWDAYGTPSTRERSTTWATKGSYSAHVVTDAANEGVVIQSSISLTAGKQYQGRVTVKIVSGTWRLEIYLSDGTVVDGSEQATAGQWVMEAMADSGGTAGLRLYCTSATGECYADAAVFQEIATRAETGWYENSKSQDDYGVIELISSQAGLTDAAANALAQNTLNAQAWARVKPPASIDTPEREVEDSLYLVFLGYAYTLRNWYTDLMGTEDEADNIITDLIGESEFVTAGKIETNTLSYYVEDYGQYRAWDIVREVTQAGDASGNRWTCGVYAGRKFYYEQASTTPVARIRNGRVLSQNGGPLEGWLAEPGLVALDDMPIAYDIGDREEDKSNMAWMNEVEFDLGEYLKGGDGITYRQVSE